MKFLHFHSAKISFQHSVQHKISCAAKKLSFRHSMHYSREHDPFSSQTVIKKIRFPKTRQQNNKVESMSKFRNKKLDVSYKIVLNNKKFDSRKFS